MSERTIPLRTNSIRNDVMIPALWVGAPTSKPNSSFDSKAYSKFTSFENQGRREEIVNEYTTTPTNTSSRYDARHNTKNKQVFEHN
jgi:hypothetical protein